MTIVDSAQPFFSKWWWIGAIIKILLPVSLKEATCTITEIASNTKSPPVIANTISCFVVTPTAPKDPPKALGGSLGAVGVTTKHEIVLAITGGLFVLEAISVIVQVASFKLTGKRIFMMAPIHHHFEKKGWAESTIVIRFWIISLILAMIGLATLKLRWNLQRNSSRIKKF